MYLFEYCLMEKMTAVNQPDRLSVVKMLHVNEVKVIFVQHISVRSSMTYECYGSLSPVMYSSVDKPKNNSSYNDDYCHTNRSI